MTDGCVHQHSTLVKDVILVLIAIGLFFVLREFFDWMFKTNHIRSDIRRNRDMLGDIMGRLDRNGLQ